MTGVDLSRPEMTEAELSQVGVTARLAAATSEAPADLSRLRLNGLDLTGALLIRADLHIGSIRGARSQGRI